MKKNNLENLSKKELMETNGGFIPQILTGIAIYDAATDFYKGVRKSADKNLARIKK
ncbi:class IIb bacteriocin, lactobin A/cerein 7B family [Bacillus cereus]|nr:class IIb bacteriocin, lactobin A/cerein 7B family [Bacillus cereus]